MRIFDDLCISIPEANVKLGTEAMRILANPRNLRRLSIDDEYWVIKDPVSGNEMEKERE